MLIILVQFCRNLKNMRAGRKRQNAKAPKTPIESTETVCGYVPIFL